MTKKINHFKYIFSLILFGLNGIVANFISLTSYEIVFFRTLIGCLFLIFLFKLSGQTIDLANNNQHLFYIAISGIAMGISWMFLYEAYQHIGVSIATLTYCSGPVIVMLVSPWLFKERFTLAKIIGFLTVLTGILLINIQAFQDGHTSWGLFCGAMSAITYVFMVVFNKKAQSITGLKNAMVQLTAGFLTVSIFIGLKQQFIIKLNPTDWIPILILGIINTGFGCYLYFSAIGHLPVQTVAIFSYLEPLSAVIFSALFLKETLHLLQVVGAILVICGAIFAQGIFKGKNKTQPFRTP